MAAGTGERGWDGAGPGWGSAPRGLGGLCGALLPSARGLAGPGSVADRRGLGVRSPQAALGVPRGARGGTGHRADASAASAEAIGGSGARGARSSRCVSAGGGTALDHLLYSGVGAGAGGARAVGHGTAPLRLLNA